VRADLIALLFALEAAPKTKTLCVSTRSEYAIRSINYHASRNAACGWTCANGDVMKSIIQGIKARSAPIHLVHIKKDELHAHFTAATHLAEASLNLPRPAGPGNIAFPQMQPFTM
jgi:ribonuclease HI